MANPPNPYAMKPDPNRDPNPEPPQQEEGLSFLGHLLELRDRLLRIVLVILLLVAGLFSFANPLYNLLAEPLLRHLPKGSSMIATEVAAPFLTPFKLVLVLSIFTAMPYVLYQAWSFVAPGLYEREKRMGLPLMISSIVLFYAGMAFAYFVVFPLIFAFFVSVAPEGVSVMTDIGKYLDFVLKLFFAFGVAFEVPIATILLVWVGFTTPQQLSQKRPYIIVAAFVIGMLLTPPDVISQTMLAVPMWLLFEAGVWFSRYFVREPEETEEEPDEEEEPVYAAAEEYVASRELSEEELEDEFERAIAEEEAMNRANEEKKREADSDKPTKPAPDKDNKE